MQTCDEHAIYRGLTVMKYSTQLLEQKDSNMKVMRPCSVPLMDVGALKHARI